MRVCVLKQASCSVCGCLWNFWNFESLGTFGSQRRACRCAVLGADSVFCCGFSFVSPRIEKMRMLVDRSKEAAVNWLKVCLMNIYK